jgi:hypothetical protein
MNSRKGGNHEDRGSGYHERDAVSLRFMSWCFLGFGMLLYLALFYEQPAAGRVVNAVAATLLVLIGVACLLLSCRLSKKDKEADR